MGACNGAGVRCVVAAPDAKAIARSWFADKPVLGSRTDRARCHKGLERGTADVPARDCAAGDNRGARKARDIVDNTEGVAVCADEMLSHYLDQPQGEVSRGSEGHGVGLVGISGIGPDNSLARREIEAVSRSEVVVDNGLRGGNLGKCHATEEGETSNDSAGREVRFMCHALNLRRGALKFS